MQNLTSALLLEEEQRLRFSKLGTLDSLEIGERIKFLGFERELPIAVQIRIGDWIIYHASLPESSRENFWWMDRKVRVVLLKFHSTLFERVSAQERGVDWYQENRVSESTHAIQGGGLSLITKAKGFIGGLLISGLPQLGDHLLGVEVLTEFLARKVELL